MGKTKLHTKQQKKWRSPLKYVRKKSNLPFKKCPVTLLFTRSKEEKKKLLIAPGVTAGGHGRVDASFGPCCRHFSFMCLGGKQAHRGIRRFAVFFRLRPAAAEMKAPPVGSRGRSKLQEERNGTGLDLLVYTPEEALLGVSNTKLSFCFPSLSVSHNWTCDTLFVRQISIIDICRTLFIRRFIFLRTKNKQVTRKLRNLSLFRHDSKTFIAKSSTFSNCLN